ncbi:MAG: hypothetical protein JJE29_08540 [Peptostreptococcaceae bacterium]|nr:hypothetical protein [Peptostreptococcaceae bacterium]
MKNKAPHVLGVTHPKLLSVFAYELFVRGMLWERPIALAVNGIILMVLMLLYISAYALHRASGAASAGALLAGERTEGFLFFTLMILFLCLWV